MYDAIRKPLKPITFFLITLIIFQSCVSTHTLTVDHAVATEERVRIKINDEQTFVYKKLIKKDGILYGVKRISGFGLMELDLSQLEITEVKYFYPGATAALIFLSLFAVIVIVSVIDVAINGVF